MRQGNIPKLAIIRINMIFSELLAERISRNHEIFQSGKSRERSDLYGGDVTMRKEQWTLQSTSAQ